MILQSLYALYDRLKDDPEYEIAPPGYSLQKISFKVVLHPNGKLFEIQRVLTPEGRSQQIRVLGTTKPSGSRLNPCFLWDNTAYLLGFKPEDRNPQRTGEAFEAFRKRHLEVEQEIKSDAFSTVCRFLEEWSPEQAQNYPVLLEITSGFGVFQVLGGKYVHNDPAVDSWWKKQSKTSENEHYLGQCLLTGQNGFVTRLHPMIKGVKGANAQAALVGFNELAYESYGKEQSLNAPACKEAAFQYGAALNALLDGPMKFKHRTILGDSTIVFWTEKPTLVEDIFTQFSNQGSMSLKEEKPQDAKLLQKIEIFLSALRQGIERYNAIDKDGLLTKFYLLSLSPNRGRVAVRFFIKGTVQQLLSNLQKHYQHMEIERRFKEGSKNPDPEFPPTWLLLRQTARDSADIPPILAGPLLNAVMAGAMYPEGLYKAVIRRIHADREINYVRASIVKGYLVRNHKQEVSMSLDTQRKDPAYRIGRLFAALEKIQADALGDVGASIKDRFYCSASSTPKNVFPRLLRIHTYHLGKLSGGFRVIREKLIQEIMDGLNDFPSHFNLCDQGLFAIGYYHQMCDLWRKRENNDSAK